jgi:hypothetical protein
MTAAMEMAGSPNAPHIAWGLPLVAPNSVHCSSGSEYSYSRIRLCPAVTDGSCNVMDDFGLQELEYSAYS